MISTNWEVSFQGLRLASWRQTAPVPGGSVWALINPPNRRIQVFSLFRRGSLCRTPHPSSYPSRGDPLCPHLPPQGAPVPVPHPDFSGILHPPDFPAPSNTTSARAPSPQAELPAGAPSLQAGLPPAPPPLAEPLRPPARGEPGRVLSRSPCPATGYSGAESAAAAASGGCGRAPPPSAFPPAPPPAAPRRRQLGPSCERQDGGAQAAARQAVRRHGARAHPGPGGSPCADGALQRAAESVTARAARASGAARWGCGSGAGARPLGSGPPPPPGTSAGWRPPRCARGAPGCRCQARVLPRPVPEVPRGADTSCPTVSTGVKSGCRKGDRAK